MEKYMTIDGREVKFKSTGAYLLRYKAQFGRDALQDIYKLAGTVDPKTKEVKNIEDMDLEVFYDLIWTLAKTADKTIEPPMDWLDSFDQFPLMDIIPEVMDLIMSCIRSSTPSKKKLMLAVMPLLN